MGAVDPWLRQPAAQAIAWALLQFAWQGLVVGGVAAVALLGLQRSAAEIRYVVSSIALVLMLVLAAVTAGQRYQAIRAGSGAAPAGSLAAGPDVARLNSGAASSPIAGAAERVLPSVDISSTSSASARPWMPTVMIVWLTGVSLLSLRLLTGWIWVQRLRTHGVTKARDSLHAAAARLAGRLHIGHPITLLESSIVDVPTVIGFLSPVVLLPVSVLAGLTPEQIEAILAHELAHVRRHDYLVNLLQTLVETVLFYHPAVWWVSSRIRIERENCCDDVAVGLCGNRVAYATALADLEALRGAGRAAVHHPAMAASGGSLLQRVRRLLRAPSSHGSRGPVWGAGVVALLLVAGVAAGASVRSERPVQSAPVAPALAPAPALAAAQSVSISQRTSNSHGNWIWSSNGDRLEVTYTGKFEFTDDDADVRQMSPGGSLKISDGRWLFGRHAVDIRERDGRLEYHYYVNAAERPFEPEGRAWLRENLPRFVRNTGIGADARVARLLKNGGPAAVLTGISRLETAYVKRVYFTQLFRQASSLTAEQYREAMSQAGREMNGSNYELAELLIGFADRLPADETSKAAYFQAASRIRSDYELRRVLSAVIKRGPLSVPTLGNVLATARSIGSDYEQSELLRAILAQQTIDDRNRDAFFAALATMHSAYERRRVLSAVVQHPVDAATLGAALAAASRIGSDYETSTFLQEVLRANHVEGLRGPFFGAVATIHSEYERGRILKTVVQKTGTSDETLRLVLQSSRAMNGYELSQLLQLVARTHPLAGDLRAAYVSAADRLGNYDQSQALAALVRSERRQ